MATNNNKTMELPADAVRPDPDLKISPNNRPPNIHLAQRHPLGVHPVPLLTGLAVFSLLVAIVLFGMGAVLAGALILVIVLVFVTLLRSAVRREPEAPLARTIIQAVDRSRSVWERVGVSVRTGWRTTLNLLRIRGRQWRLRSDLQRHLKPLGEAIYREDHTRAQALKRQAKEIEHRLRASEEEAAGVAEAARRDIRRERAANQPTEVISAPRE